MMKGEQTPDPIFVRETSMIRRSLLPLMTAFLLMSCIKPDLHRGPESFPYPFMRLENYQYDTSAAIKVYTDNNVEITIHDLDQYVYALGVFLTIKNVSKSPILLDPGYSFLMYPERKGQYVKYGCEIGQWESLLGVVSKRDGIPDAWFPGTEKRVAILEPTALKYGVVPPEEARTGVVYGYPLTWFLTYYDENWQTRLRVRDRIYMKFKGIYDAASKENLETECFMVPITDEIFVRYLENFQDPSYGTGDLLEMYRQGKYFKAPFISG